MDKRFGMPRTILVLVVCVFLNLIRVVVSRLIDSLLFLDLTGTAIASLMYGPIHGALVGLASNFIGEQFGMRHYFLFALVHVLVAAVWGVAPRLLGGKFLTDFFNDDLNDDGTRHLAYDYSKLLLGLVMLSFTSHVAASAAIAFLMYAYSGVMSCALVPMDPTVVQRPTVILCDTARLIFSEDTHAFRFPLIKIFVAKLALGWPDLLIALSVSVLLIAVIFSGRRYKMPGPFGRTFFTQPKLQASIVVLCFVIFSLYRVYFAFGYSDYRAALLDLLIWYVYSLAFILLFVFSNSEYLPANLDGAVYGGVNADLERAFEDALKLCAIVAVVIFVAIKFNCKTKACDQLGALDDIVTGGNKFTGVVGIVFLITFVRHLSLIVARSGRAIRKLITS